jgi:hypothetical protein
MPGPVLVSKYVPSIFPNFELVWFYLIVSIKEKPFSLKEFETRKYCAYGKCPVMSVIKSSPVYKKINLSR